MFGPEFRVGYKEERYRESFYITLRPFRKVEMGEFANAFSSSRVHKYTLQLFGFTQEQEERWYEDNSTNVSQVTWAICVDSEEFPIGVTGLHGINGFHQSCTSGITISNPNWWGKGVASRAHIARTMYAAEYLDRATIQSEVFRGNKASASALKAVGYHVTGISPRTRRVGSEFQDTLLLTWFNPFWTPRLFPMGVPTEYQEALSKAKATLEKAKEVVELV